MRCICFLCVLRRASNRTKLAVPCKFNLFNRCKFPCDECRFTHYEFDDIPPCRLGEKCRFGPTKCLFLHDSVEEVGINDENLPHCNHVLAVEDHHAGTATKKKKKKKKKKKMKKKKTTKKKK